MSTFSRMICSTSSNQSAHFLLVSPRFCSHYRLRDLVSLRSEGFLRSVAFDHLYLRLLHRLFARLLNRLWLISHRCPLASSGSLAWRFGWSGVRGSRGCFLCSGWLDCLRAAASAGVGAHSAPTPPIMSLRCACSPAKRRRPEWLQSGLGMSHIEICLCWSLMVLQSSLTSCDWSGAQMWSSQSCWLPERGALSSGLSIRHHPRINRCSVALAYPKYLIALVSLLRVACGWYFSCIGLLDSQLGSWE